MSRQESFATGRVVIGLVTVLMGLQTLFNGQESYEHSLHELRKSYLPTVHADQYVCSGFKVTWVALNVYFIKTLASVLLLSGILILLNKRCLGGCLLVLSVSLIIIVKDNPWQRHDISKTRYREFNEKLSDFLRNLSLLGSAFVLMWHKGHGRCCN